jgi:excisionase family DNA binding protein
VSAAPILLKPVGRQQQALLTVDEVATMLQLSRGWVRDHASGRRRPALASVKLGKALRFRMEDVLGFIEECTRHA